MRAIGTVLGAGFLIVLGLAAILWATSTFLLPTIASGSRPVTAPAPTAQTAPTSKPSESVVAMSADTTAPEADASTYKATGPTTKRWQDTVPSGSVAIIGGYIVNGVPGGVYEAIVGPATLDRTVKDGFMVVVTQDKAQAEWCKRIQQADRENWAHTHEKPLAGWTCS